MRFKQSKRVKALAAFVMFAVAQISVQLGFAEPGPNAVPPVPQQYIARLRTSGNRPITVNNNAAATGASLVTGAMIETGADQSATIDIGDFTLDIAPNTRLRLDYDDQGRIKVFLISGCAIVRSKGKTEAEIQTADNVTQGQTAKKRGGVIDICFINGQATVNQNAAANAGAGAGAGTAAAGGGGGLSTAAIAAIVLAGVGGAIVTIVAVSDDDEQVNPSPSSPTR
ncbi:MAG TPA: hypothetical protein VFH15_11040 [Pyrinomonadaceae bacterium]|nr:hypothetical protein [Pyrinomonadaceae bacterium]